MQPGDRGGQVDQPGAGRIPGTVDHLELGGAIGDRPGQGPAEVLVTVVGDEPDAAALEERREVLARAHLDSGVADRLDQRRLRTGSDMLGRMQGVPGLDREQPGRDAGRGQQPDDGAHRCGIAISQTPGSTVMATSP
ncbi:hypothetical protein GCM10029992_27810 [Glycomyces albus]